MAITCEHVGRCKPNFLAPVARPSAHTTVKLKAGPEPVLQKPECARIALRGWFRV